MSSFPLDLIYLIFFSFSNFCQFTHAVIQSDGLLLLFGSFAVLFHSINDYLAFPHSLFLNTKYFPIRTFCFNNRDAMFFINLSPSLSSAIGDLKYLTLSSFPQGVLQNASTYPLFPSPFQAFIRIPFHMTILFQVSSQGSLAMYCQSAFPYPIVWVCLCKCDCAHQLSLCTMSSFPASIDHLVLSIHIIY